MDIFYYVIHRMYNAFRQFYAPSLQQYKRFKADRKIRKEKFWKDTKYNLVDKK